MVRGYKDSREPFRTLLDTAHDAIFLMRGDRFIDCNPRTLSMFGCNREDIIGQPPDRFSPELQPDGRSSETAAAQYIQAAIGGEAMFFEWVHCRLDGHVFDAEVSLNGVQLKGEPHLLAVVRDITGRKQAEREREDLAIGLRQAQRLEALGTLAGGIAHDFNNLLQAILGYSDLLLMDSKVGDRGHIELSGIAKAAQMGARLTKRLLTLSRQEKADAELVDFNQLISDMGGLLQRIVPSMIEIKMELASDLSPIMADRGQMEQVLMNLAINAKDAMPEGGCLTFKTDLFELASCSEPLNARLGAGETCVRLEVSDTGFGMVPDVAEHAFEPFFSTKPRDKGSGLGLSMVYGIIKGHGGHVSIESEEGRGTRFIISLPCDVGVTLSKEDMFENGAQIVGGDETLLLVDDEESLRELGRQLFVRHGYRVLTVDSGEAALDLLRAKGSHVDLILLDQIMPGMGGRKCLALVCQEFADLPVLILSGHVPAGSEADLLSMGAKGFLRKPLNARNLLSTVREVLDAEKEEGLNPRR